MTEGGQHKSTKDSAGFVSKMRIGEGAADMHVKKMHPY